MKKTASFLFASVLFANLFFGNLHVFADADRAKREIVQTEVKFTDIDQTYWAKNEIMQLVENGLMDGYRDLQFRPAAPITVGEAAKVFYLALSLPKASNEISFDDIDDEDEQLKNAVRATIAEGIFAAKSDRVFGADEPLTIAKMSSALSKAFNVHLTKEDLVNIGPLYKDILAPAKLSKLPTSVQVFVEDQLPVDRATFAFIVHQILMENGTLVSFKNYILSDADYSTTFKPVEATVHLLKVSFDEHPIYLRSTDQIVFDHHERIDYGFSRDNIYTYSVGEKGAAIELTVRSFDNGDYFLFSKLENPSASELQVDVLQKENFVDSYAFYRFDRNQIKRNSDDVFNADRTSYPTGVLRFINEDGTVQERMVGQAYRSRQLSMDYDHGGRSQMRELLKEEEALSFTKIGSTFMSVHTLLSNGNDIVDQWYLNSENLLFENDDHRENWMLESAKYYKKRNSWYTALGPFNKMATTTEPLPENGQGYGRNLLLLKEDRAMELYHQQQDRYFENLIYNSFVNLQNFRGDKPYWETEVTSTYLKDLYGITAPFIDTRFNEQIALFYYRSGDVFGIEDYQEPLRNYADLLASQKEEGHVIVVGEDAYYISDYFPIIQDVPTHASMNHVLGGMNILLMAYNEFDDEKYLETARSIQKAIAIQKEDWLRNNNDIWYRISPDLDFKGDDYKHLTLEDLINSYKLWSDIDKTFLPVLEEMIESKAAYLSDEQLGYTTKIKKGLEEIGLLKYLPEGEERTDAL